MTTDLTVGKPSQKLFWFSIPLLLSVAFQQLYQMADSIIVGRFAETVEAGELALAAVGASYPITQLFVAVATGINIGTGVLVSQLFGAKRYLRMKTAISTALLTTTTVALLLTLIGAIGTHGIMNALSTPENIFADGSLYLRVYVFGLLFLFIYNVCTGCLLYTSLQPNWFRAGGGRLGGRSGQPLAIPLSGGTVRRRYFPASVPVSYTHLDVYKRQAHPDDHRVRRGLR